MIDAAESYRQTEVALMKQHMRYSRKDFEDDWKALVALAEMQAAGGEKPHLQSLMQIYGMRIEAYHAVTGEVPFGD